MHFFLEIIIFQLKTNFESLPFWHVFEDTPSFMDQCQNLLKELNSITSDLGYF